MLLFVGGSDKAMSPRKVTTRGLDRVCLPGSARKRVDCGTSARLRVAVSDDTVRIEPSAVEANRDGGVAYHVRRL
jgi:hypothetical protein